LPSQQGEGHAFAYRERISTQPGRTGGGARWPPRGQGQVTPRVRPRRAQPGQERKMGGRERKMGGREPLPAHRERATSGSEEPIASEVARKIKATSGSEEPVVASVASCR